MATVDNAGTEIYYDVTGEGRPWCCSTASLIPGASGAIRCRP